MKLPGWPDVAELREECDAAEAAGRAFATQAEKDFALTRLIWSIGQEFGDGLLLKGGTCLSKVDLAFHRVSEDADFVIPWPDATVDDLDAARWYAPANARLKTAAAAAGMDLEGSVGTFTEGNRPLRSWRVHYPSAYGSGRDSLLVEISPRPVLQTPRKVRLLCVIDGAIASAHEAASCFALSAGEVRAEKVRAAFTRDEIRDFFDLGLFLDGPDLTSREFVELVGQKLAEWPAPRLPDQKPNFGKSALQLRRLERSVTRRLMPQLPPGAPVFSLARVLSAYNDLWNGVQSSWEQWDERTTEIPEPQA